jgi:hypothetical protein
MHPLYARCDEMQQSRHLFDADEKEAPGRYCYRRTSPHVLVATEQTQIRSRKNCCGAFKNRKRIKTNAAAFGQRRSDMK